MSGNDRAEEKKERTFERARIHFACENKRISLFAPVVSLSSLVLGEEEEATFRKKRERATSLRKRIGGAALIKIPAKTWKASVRTQKRASAK